MQRRLRKARQYIAYRRHHRKGDGEMHQQGMDVGFDQIFHDALLPRLTLGIAAALAAAIHTPIDYCFSTAVTIEVSVALLISNDTRSPTAIPCRMAGVSAVNCMVMVGQLIAAIGS
jgi:hypothetical protein